MNKKDIYFKIISFLFVITSIIFLFFNWKISLIIFSIGLVINNINKGPDFLLNMISGYLIILGIIFIFINLNLGISLIIIGVLVGYIRIIGNKTNNEYYGIMNKLSEQYNLQINKNKPWLFMEGNEGKYKINYNGIDYSIEVLKNGKFNW